MHCLPASLAAAVADFADGMPVHDASAMRGACYDVSRRLAAHLDQMVWGEDADFDIAEAALVQHPQPVSADMNADDAELAVGHWAVRVEWEDGAYLVDLTAAQFGHGGPVAEYLG